MNTKTTPAGREGEGLLLLTPEQSRMGAMKRIRESCPRWTAQVKYALWGLLELEVALRWGQKVPEDMAYRLIYARPIDFPQRVDRMDHWAELYPTRSMSPPIVRIVRKGFDPRHPGKHYDLVECFFRISMEPAELWSGTPDREGERIDPSLISEEYPDSPFSRPVRAADLLDFAAGASEAWATVPGGARINFRAIALNRRLVGVGSQRKEVP